MTSSTGCLTGNTLHRTSIAEDTIGVIVDEVEARLVEHGTSMGLGNGKANSIGETLT